MRMTALLVVMSSLFACSPNAASRPANEEFHASMNQLMTSLTQDGLSPEPYSIKNLCDYLIPLEPKVDFQHPYFFAGAALYASLINGPVGGVNAVYDLYTHQAAMFYFTGDVTQTSISLGETNTLGVAFSSRPSTNVLDAWAGPFEQIAIQASFPFTSWFSLRPQYFSSPDGRVQGISGSFVISAGLTLPIGISDTRSVWVPFDNGTVALQQNVRAVAYSTLETGTVNGQPYKYLQFAPTLGHSHKLSAASLAKELALELGATHTTIEAGALAVAIGVWRDSQETIQQLCQ